jgi:hypothetical protein
MSTEEIFRRSNALITAIQTGRYRPQTRISRKDNLIRIIKNSIPSK